jgi:exopolysaccharide biosynthesis WecB/TagA/CpsF family protein
MHISRATVRPSAAVSANRNGPHRSNGNDGAGRRTPQKDVLHLLNKMQIVSSADEERTLLRNIAEGAEPKILSFLNAHAINLCWNSSLNIQAFAASDLLLRDGIGMQLLLAGLRQPQGRNMNGTDLIPRLLEELKGRRIALWGSRDAYVFAAADGLRADGHSLISVEHGFHGDDHYIALCNELRPEIILLGMGMPRQELLALRLKNVAPSSCVIINGGAIIDFMSGRHPRAPEWVQKLGFEWAFRLLREPKRLARRYLVGNAVFLLRGLLLAGRRADSTQTRGRADR